MVFLKFSLSPRFSSFQILNRHKYRLFSSTRIITQINLTRILNRSWEISLSPLVFLRINKDLMMPRKEKIGQTSESIPFNKMNKKNRYYKQDYLNIQITKKAKKKVDIFNKK